MDLRSGIRRVAWWNSGTADRWRQNPRYRSHRIVQPNWNAPGRLLRRDFLGRKKCFNFSKILFNVHYFLYYTLLALCQVEDGAIEGAVIWRYFRGPGKIPVQYVWDLWWTECHQKGFYLSTVGSARTNVIGCTTSFVIASVRSSVHWNIRL
jgi:hypothetical protein